MSAGPRCRCGRASARSPVRSEKWRHPCSPLGPEPFRGWSAPLPDRALLAGPVHPALDRGLGRHARTAHCPSRSPAGGRRRAEATPTAHERSPVLGRLSRRTGPLASECAQRIPPKGARRCGPSSASLSPALTPRPAATQSGGGRLPSARALAPRRLPHRDPYSHLSSASISLNLQARLASPAGNGAGRGHPVSASRAMACTAKEPPERPPPRPAGRDAGANWPALLGPALGTETTRQTQRCAARRHPLSPQLSPQQCRKTPGRPGSAEAPVWRADLPAG